MPAGITIIAKDRKDLIHELKVSTDIALNLMQVVRA